MKYVSNGGHLPSLGYHCFNLAPQQEYSVVVDAIRIEILIIIFGLVYVGHRYV